MRKCLHCPGNTHRRCSAKRKRRHRRANPSDSSAGWSRLPKAVVRLLSDGRGPCRCSDINRYNAGASSSTAPSETFLRLTPGARKAAPSASVGHAQTTRRAMLAAMRCSCYFHSDTESLARRDALPPWPPTADSAHSKGSGEATALRGDSDHRGIELPGDRGSATTVVLNCRGQGTATIVVLNCRGQGSDVHHRYKSVSIEKAVST